MRPWQLRSLVWETAWGDPTDKLIMLVLAEHADEEASCWPAQATIAEHCEISVDTVQRRLRKLEERGLILRQRRHHTSNGNRLADRYFIQVEAVVGLSRNLRPREGPKPQHGCGLDQTAPPTGISRGTPSENPHVTLPSVELLHTRAPTFEDFWQVYPRRDDRRRAVAAWAKAVTRADPVRIIAGAERYRDDPNRDKTFTKQPATWLNADAWDNDPLPPREPVRAARPSAAQRGFANIDRFFDSQGGAHERQRGPSVSDRATSQLPAGRDHP